MKDLKYLVAYALPLVVILSLSLRGYWSFFAPIFAFVLIPILEIMMPVDASNISEVQKEKKATNVFFDWLLYLNIPLMFAIITWFLWSITWAGYEWFELVGLSFSIGIAFGSNGINVAHELGHRKTKRKRFLSKLLLLPTLNMHFYIEHNFGHHQRAATAEDPASAKYNQSVYSFWISSITGQYVSAWHIQQSLLKNKGVGFFSIYNDMLWYTIFQLAYLTAIFILLSPAIMFVAIGIAIAAQLLLETINYIEHYGLRRLKTPSGRYERVREVHSWNSNHVLGRIMLYELTRHSDHHYRAHKKYQLLEYHEVSPQLPYGYPTSMVLTLIPPLWFSLMNKRIPIEMKPA